MQAANTARRGIALPGMRFVAALAAAMVLGAAGGFAARSLSGGQAATAVHQATVQSGGPYSDLTRALPEDAQWGSNSDLTRALPTAAPAYVPGSEFDTSQLIP